jgi:hypothetical protein
VFTALRSGHDVIEVLGLMTAVLTAVTVALEDRSAIHRDSSLMRNTHVSFEPNDRWRRHRYHFGPPERAIRHKQVGPIPQYEHQRASHGNHRERFQARVENKGS